jgi:UMF1 family MFS transporter
MRAEEPIRQPPRKAIGAWALFDFANSVLITNGGLYFSQWLVVDYHSPDSWFNFALSFTSVLVLATAPMLGALEDRKGRWLSILWITASLMSMCAIFMAIAPRFIGSAFAVVLLNLALFCVINYCYELSSMFYDSLLARVASPELYGRVSGAGFAAGWIGAIFGLLAIYPFAQGTIRIFVPPSRIDNFIPAAVLYAALTALSLIGLRSLTRSPARGDHTRKALHLRAMLAAVGAALKQRNVRVFLGIYFIMSGAVLTVQANMPLYLEIVMSFPDRAKIALICGFLIIAALGAVSTGYIGDRIGLRLSLSTVTIGWMVGLTVMIATTQRTLFLVAFSMLALLFGAVWTLLRAIYSRIAPDEQRVMYFGVYASVERLAFVVLPAIWGGVMVVLQNTGAFRYRAGVGVMIVISAFALILIPKLNDGAASGELQI